MTHKFTVGDQVIYMMGTEQQDRGVVTCVEFCGTVWVRLDNKELNWEVEKSTLTPFATRPTNSIALADYEDMEKLMKRLILMAPTMFRDSDLACSKIGLQFHQLVNDVQTHLEN